MKVKGNLTFGYVNALLTKLFPTEKPMAFNLLNAT